MRREELLNSIQTTEKTIDFLIMNKVLKYRCLCAICNNEMKKINYKCIDNVIWNCQNYINGVKHNKKTSIRYNSIFFKSSLDLRTCVIIIYEWSIQTKICMILNQIKISKKSLINWFFKFRIIISKIVDMWKVNRIGGNNLIVEIDECQIGRKKYNRGRNKDDVWIVGGIVRNSNPRICFIEIVEERSMAVLTDIVCRNVQPGTIIITDEWAGYNNLSKKGKNSRII